MPHTLCIVHSDLTCGPLPSTPYFGFKYLLAFTDSYSKCTWDYLLKLKSEFFDMFFSYKTLVEKQLEHQLLKAINDNGGEYVDTTIFFTT